MFSRPKVGSDGGHYRRSESSPLQQPAHREQQESNESAHERTVDPNELKITPDLQLDPGRGLVGVPATHRARNQVTHLVAVLLDDLEHCLDDPSVDLLEQR